MMETTSAKRLYEVLKELFEQIPDNFSGSVGQAWAKYFDEPIESIECLKEITALRTLFIECSESVKQSSEIGNEAKKVYMEALSQIGIAFSIQGMGNRWLDIKFEFLTDHYLNILILAHENIIRTSPTIEIESEEISDLVGKFEQVMVTLESEDIDPLIKRYIYVQADSILSVLKFYKVFGKSGLDSKIDEAIGGLITRSKTILSEKKSKGIQKYVEAIKAAAAIVRKTSGTVQAIEHLSSLIE